MTNLPDIYPIFVNLLERDVKGCCLHFILKKHAEGDFVKDPLVRAAQATAFSKNDCDCYLAAAVLLEATKKERRQILNEVMG